MSKFIQCINKVQMEQIGAEWNLSLLPQLFKWGVKWNLIAHERAFIIQPESVTFCTRCRYILLEENSCPCDCYLLKLFGFYLQSIRLPWDSCLHCVLLPEKLPNWFGTILQNLERLIVNVEIETLVLWWIFNTGWSPDITYCNIFQTKSMLKVLISAIKQELYPGRM